MGIAFPKSRLSASMWASVSAALAAAAAAFAGLYPQLDSGKLRLLLMVTAAAFAAPLVGWALRAPTRSKAVARTVGVAMVLGVAASVPPALVLLLPEAGIGAVIYGVAVFGGVLGASTGFAYGAPLALLVALTSRRISDGSHDATDRAQRASGVWLALVSAFAALVSTSLAGSGEYGVVPTVFAAAVAMLGASWAILAQRRLARRAAWLARVRLGHEPRFRIRALDERDDLAALPRLSSHGDVVEMVPDHDTTAYRATAIGSAVAVV